MNVNQSTVKTRFKANQLGLNIFGGMLEGMLHTGPLKESQRVQGLQKSPTVPVYSMANKKQWNDTRERHYTQPHLWL